MAGQFFSQRFGYATHALAFMAKKPTGELTTLPELADWLTSVWPSASPTYLSAVIQRLARGGILRSHRGIGGGYSLARPPAKITLREISELMQGVALPRCGLSLEAHCPVQGQCGIQGVLWNIEQKCLSLLEKVTVKDLGEEMALVQIKGVRRR